MNPKQPKKSILLVDDDKIFLKGMMYLVKGLGYETHLCSSGKEAVDFLVKNTVDLVISDINMPDGNGLQLLNWTRKNSKVPVILMTGLSDLNETQKALELGAKFFLTKPFKKEELADAVQKVLNNLVSEPKVIRELIALHIEEFLTGQDMKFPVFLKTNERTLKISAGGEALSAEVVRNCRENGIDELFVERDSYIDYLEMTEFCKTKSSLEVKNHWREVLKKELLPFEFLKELNSKVYRRGIQQIETLVDILCDNPEAVDLLEKMHKSDDFLRRSVNVCFFAILTAQYARVLTSKELFYLGFAGLFHEIGLLGTEQNVTDVPVESLTSAEKEILWFHPLRGVEVIRQTGKVPHDILRLISEHHEDYLGKGYPESLHKKQLHKFTGILSVADTFALVLEDKDLNEEVVLEILHDFSVHALGRFEPDVIEALSLVFNQALPMEFIQFQLLELNREVS